MQYPKFKIGDIVDSFTIISRVEDSNSNTGKRPQWLVKCNSCGYEKVIGSRNTSSGRRVACICEEHKNRGRTTHQMSGSRKDYVYRAMKSRCFNPNDLSYHNYGGRGITVCDRWLYGDQDSTGLECFLSDMGEYQEGHEVDRINVNGNYEPNNCRWVFGGEQAFNQRKYLSNTSGKTGVTWHEVKQKWISRISFQNKRINLGDFDTFEKAKEVREAAEIRYYGYNKE